MTFLRRLTPVRCAVHVLGHYSQGELEFIIENTQEFKFGHQELRAVLFPRGLQCSRAIMPLLWLNMLFLNLCELYNADDRYTWTRDCSVWMICWHRLASAGPTMVPRDIAAKIEVFPLVRTQGMRGPRLRRQASSVERVR